MMIIINKFFENKNVSHLYNNAPIQYVADVEPKNKSHPHNRVPTQYLFDNSDSKSSDENVPELVKRYNPNDDL